MGWPLRRLCLHPSLPVLRAPGPAGLDLVSGGEVLGGFVRGRGAARVLAAIRLRTSASPSPRIGLAARVRGTALEGSQWRREIFHSSWRAASVVDRLARPDATVAIDCGLRRMDIPDLRRRHLPLRSGDSRSNLIGTCPDRGANGWRSTTRSPRLGTSRLPGHVAGVPLHRPGNRSRAGDARLPQPGAEPDFKLVYFLPRFFQAVFQRVRPVPAPVNPRRPAGSRSRRVDVCRLADVHSEAPPQTVGKREHGLHRLHQRSGTSQSASTAARPAPVRASPTRNGTVGSGTPPRARPGVRRTARNSSFAWSSGAGFPSTLTRQPGSYESSNRK